MDEFFRLGVGPAARPSAAGTRAASAAAAARSATASASATTRAASATAAARPATAGPASASGSGPGSRVRPIAVVVVSVFPIAVVEPAPVSAPSSATSAWISGGTRSATIAAVRHRAGIVVRSLRVKRIVRVRISHRGPIEARVHPRICSRWHDGWDRRIRSHRSGPFLVVFSMFSLLAVRSVRLGRAQIGH